MTDFSTRETIQVAAVYVPILQRVLRTVPPTIPEWAVIGACALLPVVVVELVKFTRSMVTGREAAARLR